MNSTEPWLLKATTSGLQATAEEADAFPRESREDAGVTCAAGPSGQTTLKLFVCPVFLAASAAGVC